MCGRLALTLPTDAMARLFAAAPANDLPAPPNYNICPTTRIPVVSRSASGRRLSAMRWGFLPHWYQTPNAGPLLINARSETIAEKPAFRAACRDRRCLIPCDGFYEWARRDGAKLPWFIRRADGAPLVMAGIWQDWRQSDDACATCAIVTTEARGRMAVIHHRMPVILAQDDWPLWLGEAGKGAARLMTAAPDEVIDMHRVGPEVNSNRAVGPGLIAPLSAP
ncbi:SOS response-associated peptidase [Pseudooceanicola sp.]|uniref:SOS response-associated peptidase n=1 Tax=Pseudooceanicola sp. TaxID=1914328 RepID=UPI00261C5D23|nr:SOS response-associated peptidase [Pseudooceanicola sp.]MDF1857302.1 SOS response-associated peptidase [Pseudooceanicola sp.]